MSEIDYLTLAGTTAVIALVLVVEHFFLERFGKPWTYAIGLPTAMGGVLAWAWLRGMAVTLEVAVAMLAAACLAGIPDAVLILWEQRKQQEVWEALVRSSRQQAAQLALMERMGGREWKRTRDLAETLSFALGTAQREMEQLALFQEQAEPLLRPILEAWQEKLGDES